MVSDLAVVGAVFLPLILMIAFVVGYAIAILLLLPPIGVFFCMRAIVRNIRGASRVDRPPSVSCQFPPVQANIGRLTFITFQRFASLKPLEFGDPSDGTRPEPEGNAGPRLILSRRWLGFGPLCSAVTFRSLLLVPFRKTGNHAAVLLKPLSHTFIFLMYCVSNKKGRKLLRVAVTVVYFLRCNLLLFCPLLSKFRHPRDRRAINLVGTGTTT